MGKKMSGEIYECCYNQKAIDRILAVLDGNGRPSLQSSLQDINNNITNMKEDICELKDATESFYDMERTFSAEIIRREEREKFERKKEERLKWIVPLVVSNIVILFTLLMKIIFDV